MALLQFTWRPSNCPLFRLFLGAHGLDSASAPLPVGELRYIARLRRSTITNGFPAATTDGGSAIEGSDVFLVNGQTRSKFYSSRQFIDDAVKGVSGPGIAIHMVRRLLTPCLAAAYETQVVDPPRGFEGSSGGPFFRDIDNQCGMFRRTSLSVAGILNWICLRRRERTVLL